jgi:hypothetical protein
VRHCAWDDLIRRVPIILTGNDLSTLYAPLLRDGRGLHSSTSQLNLSRV